MTTGDAGVLREAARVMRARAEAATAQPPGTTRCGRHDHPSRVHGHYGYGGAYWCSDFGSPLLSEENMGSQRRYAKPASSPDVFRLAVADWLDLWADLGDKYEFPEDTEHLIRPALAVATAYLGEPSP